eukprot:CAMPEP_0113580604 /NCGR_PEP_ID=MMETSP0015_2-20120614/30780_1 /TAXON_ID=2838 /ORGANISM="Odontella" /LENGTH=41 /DNA_ID=CAMNT_0000484841 /DNA_START=141 /DNA_END=263 /DNA_ORIENTATION=+ /assembly_acc=CAM_ASM_000160
MSPLLDVARNRDDADAVAVDDPGAEFSPPSSPAPPSSPSAT